MRAGLGRGQTYKTERLSGSDQDWLILSRTQSGSGGKMRLELHSKLNCMRNDWNHIHSYIINSFKQCLV